MPPVVLNDLSDEDFTQLYGARTQHTPWEYDVICDPGEPGQWVNRRLLSMTLPLDKATWRDPEGIPYINPEILLLFKAPQARPGTRRTLWRSCLSSAGTA